MIVTDEMVEAALAAYVKSRGTYELEVAADEEDIRAALDAAIALMRGQSEYVPAGFLLDGPSDWAFVPTRELIESRIAIVCFENGDDQDDYTATEVFVRMTDLPAPPKDTADEQ